MASRIAAVILGLSAGLATGLFFALDWSGAIAFFGLDRPDIAAALADQPSRIAVGAIVAVVVYGLAALLIALAAGLAETLVARSRVDALRHDISLSGRWTAADWRAAFAHSAIADRAEAVIAAPVSATSAGSDRRVLIDPSLLIGLEATWLDRLTLTPMIAPLPPLLIGAGALASLLHYAGNGAGAVFPLAFGIGGWLLLGVLRYLVRSLLAPAVELAMRAASAAVRPLTPILALDGAIQRLGDATPQIASAPAKAALKLDPAAIASGLGNAVAEPLAKLVAAADRIAAAGTALTERVAGEVAQSAAKGAEAVAAATAPLTAAAETLRGAVVEREKSVDQALAEVRSAIEGLLTQAPAEPGAGSGLADALRGAVENGSLGLARQIDSLREAVDRLGSAGRPAEGGADTALLQQLREQGQSLSEAAQALRAAAESFASAERKNDESAMDLGHAVDRLAAGFDRLSTQSAADAPAIRHAGSEAAQPMPQSNPAIADALKNLLREFGDG
jgi:hypothetical protein